MNFNVLFDKQEMTHERDMNFLSGEQEFINDRAMNLDVDFGKREMTRDLDMSFHAGELAMTHACMSSTWNVREAYMASI